MSNPFKIETVGTKRYITDDTVNGAVVAGDILLKDARGRDWKPATGAEAVAARQDGSNYFIIVQTTSRGGVVSYAEFQVSSTGTVASRGTSLTTQALNTLEASYGFDINGDGVGGASAPPTQDGPILAGDGNLGVWNYSDGSIRIDEVSVPSTILRDGRGNLFTLALNQKIVGVTDTGADWTIIIESTSAGGVKSYAQFAVSSGGTVASTGSTLTGPQLVSLGLLDAVAPETRVDRDDDITDLAGEAAVFSNSRDGSVATAYFVDPVSGSNILLTDSRGDFWTPGSGVPVAVREDGGGFRMVVEFTSAGGVKTYQEFAVTSGGVTTASGGTLSAAQAADQLEAVYIKDINNDGAVDLTTATLPTRINLSDKSVTMTFAQAVAQAQITGDTETGAKLILTGTPAAGQEIVVGQGVKIEYTAAPNLVFLEGPGRLSVFSDIQSAINAAANWQTIRVGAGTFEGDVTVNKTVTIFGANAGIDGDDARKPESIIAGKVTVTAAWSELDGLTFTKPSTSTSINGQNFSGWDGVGLVVSGTGAVVTHSIVEAWGAAGGFASSGFVLYSGDSGTFEGNLVKAGQGYNAATDARGVASVFVSGTGSFVIDNNHLTVSTDNADALNIVSGNVTVKNNTITGDIDGGIVAFAGFGNLTITDNTIDSYNDNGIRVFNHTGASGTMIILSGNTVDGPNPLTVDANGSLVYKLTASAPLTTPAQLAEILAANPGVSTLLVVNSVGFVPQTFTFDGKTVNSVQYGNADANTFSGGSGVDLFFGNGGNDAIDGGDGVDTVVVAAGSVITASGTGWQVTGTDGTDTLNNVEIVGAGGAKTLLVGNGGFATIQDAVNAASNGDTILVSAGSYTGIVAVNKDVTILGAKAGVAGTDAARGTDESVLTGGFDVTAAGATLDGFKVVQGATMGGEPAGVYVRADGVTVTNMLMDGPGALTTMRGIVTATGTSDDLTISNSLITNFLTGVYLNPGSERVTIKDNTFNANTISIANDGFDSTDTYVGNVFAQRVSGATEGSIDGGAIITANTFTNGTAEDVRIAFNGSTPVSITGTDYDDVLRGGSGNDTLTGGKSGDLLVGRGGVDTAAYATVITASKISASAADLDPTTSGDQPGWVVATGGDEGSDNLVGMSIVDGAEAGKFLLVGNGGFATIQAAVDAASDGDTILVANGSYAGASIADKAIAIIGAGDAVTITGTLSSSGELAQGQELRFQNLSINAAGQSHGISARNTAAEVPGVNAGTITLQGVTIKNASQIGFFYSHPSNGSNPTNPNTVGTIVIEGSTFSQNGEIYGGARGQGHVNLFGFNGNLTVRNSSFETTDKDQGDAVFRVAGGVNTPGAAVNADKAITVTGIRVGTPGVGGYADAGALVLDNVDVTGFYGSDVLSFYTIGSFASMAISDVTVNAQARWALINFDSVSGPIDLSGGFTGTNSFAGAEVAELQGLATNDAITGTAGNDLIYGRGGADDLSGGAGNDVFVYTSSAEFAAGEAVDGGAGTDAIFFQSLTGETLTLSSAVTNVETVALSTLTVNYGSTIGTVNHDQVALGVDASAVTTGLTITGNSAANMLMGTAQADSISGGAGNDVITGGAGDDSVDGGDGVDTFVVSDMATITTTATGWQVVGADGTDTLSNAEIVDVGGAGGVRTLLVGNGGFATIQEAVDAANAGETILVAAGTYDGGITVNKAGLTITAIGDVVIKGGFKAANGIASDASAVDYLQTGPNYSGVGTGITISASGVTLEGLKLTSFNTAVELGNGISDTVLRDLHLDGGVNGVRKGTAAVVNDLTIDGGSFTDLAYGIYIAKAIGSGKLTGFTVDGSSFAGLLEKGIYLETGSDVLITGITMDDVGQFGRGSAFSPSNAADTGEFGNGIDINLKYDDGTPYSNIIIKDFTFTDVGLSGGVDAIADDFGAAIAIKARDDASSYNTNPATVSGPVIVRNGTIDGTSTGIRAGEPGKAVTTPAVQVENVTVTNAAVAAGDNVTKSTMTVTLTSGNDTWTMAPTSTGQVSINGGMGNDAITGGGGVDTVVVAAGSVITASGTGWQVTGTDGTDTLSNVEIVDAGGAKTLLVGNGGFATIQAAVTAATAGDTIIVAEGEYSETVAVSKAVAIHLDDDAILTGGFDVGAVAFTLEGGTIKGGALLPSIAGKQAIFVRAGADVTVQDTVFDGTGSTGQDRAIEAGVGVGKITVDGATLANWAAAAIYVNPGDALTVTGSTFTGNLVGIGTDGPAKLVVTGNSFDNTLEAVGLTAGKVIGEFQLTGNTFAETDQIPLAYGGVNTGATEVPNSANVLFVTEGQSIQAAINAVPAGGTVIVGAGTYNENISINKAGITLLAAEGRDTTKIVGSDASALLGTIQIAAGTNNVTIKGLKIEGINGNGGLEKAAVYITGDNNGLKLLDNEIMAKGDAGLQSEFGGALQNALIDGNIFSGKTFVGANPQSAANNGFTGQFDIGSDFPRQLVVLGNGGGATPSSSNNVTFSNNVISGTAGGISSVTGQPFGNNLVTIDVSNATITDNIFTGVTGAFTAALRARRDGTDITDNVFDLSKGGQFAYPVSIFVQNNTTGDIFGNSVIGSDGRLAVVGTALADALTGTEANEALFGLAGDDTLTGGLGDDTFVFTGTDIGNNTITDFQGAGGLGGDLINVDALGANTLADLTITVSGADTVITMAGITGSITLTGVTGLMAEDFLF